MEMAIQSSLQITSERAIALWHSLVEGERDAKKVRIKILLFKRFRALAVNSLIIGDLRRHVRDLGRGQSDVNPVKALVLNGVATNWLEVKNLIIEFRNVENDIERCLGVPLD